MKQKQLREIALVCKSWTESAQAALYVKVAISTNSKLKSFLHTVEQKPILGMNVKSFKYFYRGKDQSDVVGSIATLLSGLLPNLQFFYVKNDLFSYVPVLNALLESHLTSLKVIHTPVSNLSKCEVANYTTCALLMRDRLEKLHITDYYRAITEATESRLYFDRLYNKLHQFDKLNHLVIKKRTNNGIQVFEYIVEACKTLERIQFDFDDDDEFVPQLLTQGASDTITKFSPRSNIKFINGTMYIHSFSLIFSYIVHKFPQLRVISLRMISDGRTFIEPHTITLLYQHLSKLDHCSVTDLAIRPEDLGDAIGSYWDSTSMLGSNDISVRYPKNFIPGEHILLSVSRRDQDSLQTNLYSSNNDWMHGSFVETYGKYIGNISIAFDSHEEDNSDDSTDVHELPADSVPHLLQHCPHLKSLRIEGCILRQPSYFGIDLSYKTSLSKLTFSHCIIHAGVLEQLSLLVSDIEQVIVEYDVRNHRTENDVPSLDLTTSTEKPIEIMMPHTTIDSIVLYQIREEDPLRIKVYSTTEKKYYLFMCDYDYEDGNNGTEITKTISEEEFLSSAELGRYVYVCCQNVPYFLLDE
ncbi:unnamed protein product [Mucor hiemalis]